MQIFCPVKPNFNFGAPKSLQPNFVIDVLIICVTAASSIISHHKMVLTRPILNYYYHRGCSWKIYASKLLVLVSNWQQEMGCSSTRQFAHKIASVLVELELYWCWKASLLWWNHQKIRYNEQYWRVEFDNNSDSDRDVLLQRDSLLKYVNKYVLNFADFSWLANPISPTSCQRINNSQQWINHSCICHAAYLILNWREMFEDTNTPPIPDMTAIAYTGKRKEFDVDILRKNKEINGQNVR